jgi:hypothetical protein
MIFLVKVTGGPQIFRGTMTRDSKVVIKRFFAAKDFKPLLLPRPDDADFLKEEENDIIRPNSRNSLVIVEFPHHRAQSTMRCGENTSLLNRSG